jgi:peptidylprolyl isomerase
MTEPRASSRATWLLAAGAAAGLALAAWGLIRPGTGSALWLPPGAVALVNGAPIRADDFERLLAGVERDTRGEMSEEVRERVLSRMIEEELLVQRALDLGLARADRRVRANLVSAMISSVTADAEDGEPSRSELALFYEEEREFFTRPGRLRVHQVFFGVRKADEDAAAAERARLAAEQLAAGEPFAAVRDELGDEEISPLPDALLPPQKLLEYLGPTALRAALELEPGGTSPPVRSGTGYHVLRLVDAEPPRVPELDRIVDLVRAEYTRRAGDRALREYLDELRASADVVVR